MKNYISVDVGGTQLRAAIYPSDGIKPLRVLRTLTQNGNRTPTENLIALIETIWKSGDQIAAIGLAVPGAVNPHKGIVYVSPNIPGWENLHLKQLIQEQFKVPVVLGNDANLAALGEWKYGAGQGHENVLFFTISTGIGGGIIQDGKLLLGYRGLGAEVGHILIDPDGPLCSCGKKGHLEAFASGTAIARWVCERIADGEHSILNKTKSIKAKDIAQAANDGDRLSKQALDRAGYWFGLALANYLHLFNPKIVILGGGVSFSGDLIFVPIKESLHKHIISQKYIQDLIITKAALGDEAGLVGSLIMAKSMQEN